MSATRAIPAAPCNTTSPVAGAPTPCDILGAQAGNGDAEAADGGAHFAKVKADNAKVKADGVKVMADGVKVMADGVKVMADGVKVMADGVKVKADGVKVSTPFLAQTSHFQRQSVLRPARPIGLKHSVRAAPLQARMNTMLTPNPS